MLDDNDATMACMLMLTRMLSNIATTFSQLRGVVSQHNSCAIGEDMSTVLSWCIRLSSDSVHMPH